MKRPRYSVTKHKADKNMRKIVKDKRSTTNRAAVCSWSHSYVGAIYVMIALITD